MDVFKAAGEKFERTKRAFLEGKAEEAPYVCEACEEPVADAHEHCPHCGEPAVEPVESPDED